jgi:hypothetical protein
VKIAFFLFCVAASTALFYTVLTREIWEITPGAFTPGLSFYWLFMVGVSVFVGIPTGVLGYWMIWYKILKRI